MTKGRNNKRKGAIGRRNHAPAPSKVVLPDITFPEDTNINEEASHAPSVETHLEPKGAPRPSPKMSYKQRQRVIQQLQKTTSEVKNKFVEHVSTTEHNSSIEQEPIEHVSSIPKISKWMFYDIPEHNQAESSSEPRNGPLIQPEEYAVDVPSKVEPRPESRKRHEAADQAASAASEFMFVMDHMLDGMALRMFQGSDVTTSHLESAAQPAIEQHGVTGSDVTHRVFSEGETNRVDEEMPSALSNSALEQAVLLELLDESGLSLKGTEADRFSRSLLEEKVTVGTMDSESSAFCGLEFAPASIPKDLGAKDAVLVETKGTPDRTFETSKAPSQEYLSIYNTSTFTVKQDLEVSSMQRTDSECPTMFQKSVVEHSCQPDIKARNSKDGDSDAKHANDASDAESFQGEINLTQAAPSDVDVDFKNMKDKKDSIVENSASSITLESAPGNSVNIDRCADSAELSLCETNTGTEEHMHDSKNKTPISKERDELPLKEKWASLSSTSYTEKVHGAYFKKEQQKRSSEPFPGSLFSTEWHDKSRKAQEEERFFEESNIQGGKHLEAKNLHMQHDCKDSKGEFFESRPLLSSKIQVETELSVEEKKNTQNRAAVQDFIELIVAELPTESEIASEALTKNFLSDPKRSREHSHVLESAASKRCTVTNATMTVPHPGPSLSHPVAETALNTMPDTRHNLQAEPACKDTQHRNFYSVDVVPNVLSTSTTPVSNLHRSMNDDRSLQDILLNEKAIPIDFHKEWTKNNDLIKNSITLPNIKNPFFPEITQKGLQENSSSLENYLDVDVKQENKRPAIPSLDFNDLGKRDIPNNQGQFCTKFDRTPSLGNETHESCLLPSGEKVCLSSSASASTSASVMPTPTLTGERNDDLLQRQRQPRQYKQPSSVEHVTQHREGAHDAMKLAFPYNDDNNDGRVVSLNSPPAAVVSRSNGTQKVSSSIPNQTLPLKDKNMLNESLNSEQMVTETKRNGEDNEIQDALLDQEKVLAALITSKLMDVCPSHPFDEEEEKNVEEFDLAENEVDSENKEDLDILEDDLSVESELRAQETSTTALETPDPSSILDVDVDTTSFTVFENELSNLLNISSDPRVGMEDLEDAKMDPNLALLATVALREDTQASLPKVETSPANSTAHAIPETKLEEEEIVSNDNEDLSMEKSSEITETETFLRKSEKIFADTLLEKDSTKGTALAAEDDISKSTNQLGSSTSQVLSTNTESITEAQDAKSNTEDTQMEDDAPQSRSVHLADSAEEPHALNTVLSIFHQPGMPPALELAMHASFVTFIIILFVISYSTWGHILSYYAFGLAVINVGIWFLTAIVNARNRIEFTSNKEKLE